MMRTLEIDHNLTITKLRSIWSHHPNETMKLEVLEYQKLPYNGSDLMLFGKRR